MVGRAGQRKDHARRVQFLEKGNGRKDQAATIIIFFVVRIAMARVLVQQMHSSSYRGQRLDIPSI